MKKLFTTLFLIFTAVSVYTQTCGGGNTTGTHNDCFLNTSKQANINLLNCDSVIAGKWYGSTIGTTYGGTGLSTIGSSNQILRVNSGGTALEYFTPSFLTSYTETDPVFTGSDVYGVTSSDIFNWNSAYSWSNHSAAGYLLAVDTSSLSNRINLKLSKIDTLTLSNRINQKLNKADTITLSNRINLKLNKADTITLSNRINTKLSSEVDGSVTNEIQTISRTNGTINLSLNGGVIHLPDSSTTNEIELPSQTGNNGKVLTTNGTSPSWTTPNAGTITSVGVSSTDLSVSGSPVTTSGSITLDLTTTGVSAGTYDWVTVDTKGRVTAGNNTPVPTAISSGARNFNQAYQISSTRPTKISVSPQVSCSLSLSGGQSGTITLEISANGSTGWIYIGQVSGSNTGTLTIGLSTVQITGAQLTTDLPAGYYWRLTTNNVTGSPTYTFNGGSYWVY